METRVIRVGTTADGRAVYLNIKQNGDRFYTTAS